MKDNPSAFHSGEYDAKIKQTIPYYEEFYKQVVDVVKTYITGPVTWLDVGCGTGKMAQAACKEIDIEKFIFCDCHTGKPLFTKRGANHRCQ